LRLSATDQFDEAEATVRDGVAVGRNSVRYQRRE